MFNNLDKYLVSIVLSFTLIGQSVILPSAQAQMISDAAPEFALPLIAGISLYREDPLKMDFILDVTGTELSDDELSRESLKMARYFLTALTVPEQEMWVNLSPYEPERIVPDRLGSTEMGRDMLSQDLELKKLMSEFLSPDHDIGQEFWNQVYEKAYGEEGKEYGDHSSGSDSLSSFNKVWIVPDQAVVYARGRNILIADSHLKVMMEEDYLTQGNGGEGPAGGYDPISSRQSQAANSRFPILNNQIKQAIRDVIIPVIEREVNEGGRFAPLRRMFHAMILAAWYKQNLKNSILNESYSDQGAVQGIDSVDAGLRQEIYARYLGVFQKASEGMLREVYDPVRQTVAARKYVTGGVRGVVGPVGVQRSVSLMMRKFENRRLKQYPIRFNSAMMDDAADRALSPEQQQLFIPEYGSAESFLKDFDHWRYDHIDWPLVMFVRHAEPTGSLREENQTPKSWSPLSLRGKNQVAELLTFISLHNFNFDFVFSSDMERMQNTVQPLADRSRVIVILKKTLREIYTTQGLEPGVQNHLLRTLIAVELIQEYQKNPYFFQSARYPLDKFERSIERLREEIETDPQYKGNNILMGVHGQTTPKVILKFFKLSMMQFEAVQKELGLPGYVGLTAMAYDPQAGQWKLLFKPDNSFLSPSLQGKMLLKDLPPDQMKTEKSHFLEMLIRRMKKIETGNPSHYPDGTPNRSHLQKISLSDLQQQIAALYEKLKIDLKDEKGKFYPKKGKKRGDDHSGRGNPAMLFQNPGGIDLGGEGLSMRTEGGDFAAFYDAAALFGIHVDQGLAPALSGSGADFPLAGLLQDVSGL